MVFRETIFFRFSRREKLSDFYLDRSRLAMIYIYRDHPAIDSRRF